MYANSEAVEFMFSERFTRAKVSPDTSNETTNVNRNADQVNKNDIRMTRTRGNSRLVIIA